jgi:putative DNA primase/helicase
VDWLWGARAAADEKYRAADFGNARYFIDQHGDLLKFDHRRARWLIWDPGDRRWRTDRDGCVTRFWEAAAKARELNALAYEGVDDEMFEAESKAARRMGVQSAIVAALKLTQDLEPVADDGSSWDTDPLVLACLGDVVNLKTGESRPARPEDRLIKNAGVTYDPNARADRWERMLREIHVKDDGITADEEMIAFVQRFAGYSATGLTSEEKLALLHGHGRNGKTKELGGGHWPISQSTTACISGLIGCGFATHCCAYTSPQKTAKPGRSGRQGQRTPARSGRTPGWIRGVGRG